VDNLNSHRKENMKTSKRITALIIEDEEPARDLLKAYLADFDNIELVGECENGFTGIKAINENKIDLIFLDIQMPKLSGFEMLELLDEAPEIIFTTAFDEFAIKAFDMNAVDYLLKPFSRDRFKAALEKAFLKIKNKSKSKEELDNLLNHVQNNTKEIENVIVKSNHKIHIIPVEDIFNIEAEDDYVMIYTEKNKYLKHQTMKYFEEHLPASKFLRIHRSNIIRLSAVDQIQHYSKENYIVILKNDLQLKVSKSRIKELRKEFDF